MKRSNASIIATIIFLAVFSLYSIVYAATREVPAIITLYRERWDGEVWRIAQQLATRERLLSRLIPPY